MPCVTTTPATTVEAVTDTSVAVGAGVGLGLGGGVGFDVGVELEVGVEVGRGVELTLDGVAVGVAPGWGEPAAGVAPGDVFATGVGDACATPETTRSGACLWQKFCQQIFTT